jgi:hypothetical protein
MGINTVTCCADFVGATFLQSIRDAVLVFTVLFFFTSSPVSERIWTSHCSWDGTFMLLILF